MMPAVPLVASYEPPAGDRAGDQIRGRSWTYDSALTATALAVGGDVDGAGAILDTLQELQRPDGALDGSFDLAGGDPAGPLRSGNQAWVGLAASQWRALTGSRRHERLGRGTRRLAARPARGARPGPRRPRRLVGLDGAQPRDPGVPRGARRVRRCGRAPRPRDRQRALRRRRLPPGRRRRARVARALEPRHRIAEPVVPAKHARSRSLTSVEHRVNVADQDVVFAPDPRSYRRTPAPRRSLHADSR